MENTITEIKNSFNRLFIAKERSSELETSSEEIIQNVIDKEMKIQKAYKTEDIVRRYKDVY